MRMLADFNVSTVCQKSGCPNMSDCLKDLKLTFMILGNVCTRNCGFCAVEKSSEKILDSDLTESARISQMVKILGLNYLVLTSVTRDDLPDGGASQYVKTLKLIFATRPQVKAEVLIPDFFGNFESLKSVVEAGPCVVAHNLETVSRLYKKLRPQADYSRSLELLTRVKQINPLMPTKSSLLLGLGETEDEVFELMQDLRMASCDIFTLGQYLPPTKMHRQAKEVITDQQFEKYRHTGMDLGFKVVLAGAKVKSSYRAERLFKEFINV